MWRSFAFFVFSFLIVQATMGQGNDILPKGGEVDVREEEILTVSVKMTGNDDSTNSPIEIQVNFKVTIEMNVIKVNGKFTELDVLTSYELEAEIVEPLKKVRIAMVIVNVLVMKQEIENGHKFFLEEQVMFVDEIKVDQVDVKLLTIHMHRNGTEYKRTIETIAFEESRMKQKTVQKFCRKGDLAPKAKMHEAKLPDERQERGYHHVPKKSFCSWFRNLPFAARVGILVGVIFILVASVLCCACFCCRKPKNVYDISTHEEKPEFELEVEAEPLPEKLAFDDKQVLLA